MRKFWFNRFLFYCSKKRKLEKTEWKKDANDNFDKEDDGAEKFDDAHEETSTARAIADESRAIAGLTKRWRDERFLGRLSIIE